jgi:hypothetical protein
VKAICTAETGKWAKSAKSASVPATMHMKPSESDRTKYYMILIHLNGLKTIHGVTETIESLPVILSIIPPREVQPSFPLLLKYRNI